MFTNSPEINKSIYTSGFPLIFWLVGLLTDSFNPNKFDYWQIAAAKVVWNPNTDWRTIELSSYNTCKHLIISGNTSWILICWSDHIECSVCGTAWTISGIFRQRIIWQSYRKPISIGLNSLWFNNNRCRILGCWRVQFDWDWKKNY